MRASGLKVQRLRTVMLCLFASVAFASMEARAQDLLVDVAVKFGGKIVHSSSAQIPMDKRTEVKAGDTYKLRILPTLVTADEVRLDVQIVEKNAPMPLIATATIVKLSHPAKLLNGLRGDQEIELTARLK